MDDSDLSNNNNSLIESFRNFDLNMFKREILNMTPSQRHYLTERATLLAYCKIVKTGDCVFDIGANHGEHTRALQELVGNNGIVYAFEPNPNLVEALKNIGANINVFDIAVSDVESTSKLRVPKGLDSWG
jgi:predicted methyltransferase